MSSIEQRLAALAQDIQADPLLSDLQCYIVGGAVRDCLLQLPITDKDWVVVGATPEALSARGFIPVGADFPVFLHPHTHEEFALARTERKQGRGYHGFVFHAGTEVRLEDDLARRDLTINAMAVSRTGELIDPFGGACDVAQRQLRHVGVAFAEDPVRLLRLARFLARFPDFEVADDTIDLARQLIAAGEVDALVAERVWQEWQRGLLAKAPERMFRFLDSLGALSRISPGLQWSPAIDAALRCASDRDLGLAARFALLLFASPEPQPLAQGLRASKDCTEAAIALQRLAVNMRCWQQQVDAGGPDAMASWAALLQVLTGADALRRAQRFQVLLAALDCAPGFRVDTDFWSQALAAVQQVDAGAIARQFSGAERHRIPTAIARARQQALKAVLSWDQVLSACSGVPVAGLDD